jgi:hypothetical protein
VGDIAALPEHDSLACVKSSAEDFQGRCSTTISAPGEKRVPHIVCSYACYFSLLDDDSSKLKRPNGPFQDFGITPCCSDCRCPVKDTRIGLATPRPSRRSGGRVVPGCAD